jgi:VWFA-related protein
MFPAVPRMNQRLLLSLSVISLLLIAVSLRAGDKPDKSPEGMPTFNSRTQLVVVPAVVTDRSGNHIAGLKKEDFAVEENGVAQKIASFEEITSHPEWVPKAKLQDNTFSNLVQAQAGERVTVLLFDLLNTKFQDQKRAHDAMVKFLADSLDTTEPTALYLLTSNGLKVVHDFTTDPRVLAAAINRLHGTTAQKGDVGAGQSDAGNSDQIEAQSAEAAALVQALNETRDNANSVQQKTAIQVTLEAMQQLAKAYAGLPGRKSLLWATGSFPFDISDVSMGLAPAGRDSLGDMLPLYQRTWAAMNDANFAIYPIDLKGLSASAQFDAGGSSRSQPLPASMRRRGFSPSQPTPDWAQSSSVDTLKAVATATGGKAFYNDNDIAEGLREAAKDSSQYYLISYYLDSNHSQPGWRKLHVKVDHDGAHVRARSGFFEVPENSQPTGAQDAEIASALASPLDYTEIPMTLTWTKFSAGKEPGTQQVEYLVSLPANAASVDESDRDHLVMEFIALVRTPEGKLAVMPSSQVLDTHLNSTTLQQVRTIGFRYRHTLELPSGEFTVRFVARDAISGRMGSVAATLKISAMAGNSHPASLPVPPKPTH